MSNSFLLDLNATKNPLNLRCKQISFPFVWFAVSNIEKTIFQKKVFDISEVRGLLASIAEFGYKNKKLEMVEYLRNFTQKGNLLKLDSGGFSFYRSGIKLSQKEVLEEQMRLNPDLVVQLDRPLNHNMTPNQRKKMIQVSLRNLEQAVNLLDSNAVLIPTIHGWTIEELRYSIKNINEIFSPRMFSLGSMVPFFTSRYGRGNLGGRSKAYSLIKFCRTSIPNMPLHILGMGGALTPIAIGLGVDSLDSTGWIKKAAFGSVTFPGVSDRFFRREPEDRPKKGRTFVKDDKNAYQLWLKCECSMCKLVKKNYGEVNRFRLFGRRNSNAARRYRATHNVAIQIEDIKQIKLAIYENSFEELLRNRLSNSRYRKEAEKLFNVTIPRLD